MTRMNRRTFLRRSAFLLGGVAVSSSLEGLVARGALASPGRAGRGDGGYGPLVESGPELALPEGFTYTVLGIEGSIMSDGNLTPRAHDGMAAFSLPNGNIRLVRNHEDRDPPHRSSARGNPDTAYDRRGGGGTTSLEVEPQGERRLVRDFISLNGTIVNCAGGPTPWGSWLSCEESTAGMSHGWEQPHGYIFEVPLLAEDEVEPVPLRAMGRFVHEAIAVDPMSGIIYETEDRSTAGLYRFIPNQVGNLRAGGRLQMLAIKDRPNYDTATGQQVGRPLPVTWVDIDDPDPAAAESNSLAVFQQGYERGGARFSRLEGCWYADGSIFFHATDGGDVNLGQVWQYRPLGRSGGLLQLIFESTGPEILDGPDNITVSPRGGIVICEDGDGEQYLRGLTRDGRIFDFARGLVHDGEFAGACFSPDGQTLFANIMGDTRSGGAGKLAMTFAIWGPWERGAL